jgi:hypothetical protein
VGWVDEKTLVVGRRARSAADEAFFVGSPGRLARREPEKSEWRQARSHSARVRIKTARFGWLIVEGFARGRRIGSTQGVRIHGASLCVEAVDEPSVERVRLQADTVEKESHNMGSLLAKRLGFAVR